MVPCAQRPPSIFSRGASISNNVRLNHSKPGAPRPFAAPPASRGGPSDACQPRALALTANGATEAGGGGRNSAKGRTAPVRRRRGPQNPSRAGAPRAHQAARPASPVPASPLAPSAPLSPPPTGLHGRRGRQPGDRASLRPCCLAGAPVINDMCHSVRREGRVSDVWLRWKGNRLFGTRSLFPSTIRSEL